MVRSIDDDGKEESERAHRRDQALEVFNWSRDADESCDGRSASDSQEPLGRAPLLGRASPHGPHSGICFSLQLFFFVKQTTVLLFINQLHALTVSNG